MLDTIDDLDPRQVLLAVEESRRRRLQAEADQLALAAHWCDLHGEVRFDAEARVAPGSEILVALGGEGTPEVEEFAAAEFGAMNHQHPMAARHLMGDALDLRHRLPRTWRAVHELRLETWVARRIAARTRVLDRSGASYVDEAVAPYLESLPAGRLLALMEAKIIEADPDRAEEARLAAEEARFVRTVRDPHGISTVVARAATGDVVVLDAMVQRIAEILGEDTDTELDVRRAEALGLLARPAAALKLLVDAAGRAEVPPEELTAELDPDLTLSRALERVDPTALVAPVRLFVHLTQDALDEAPGRVARIEGQGPVLARQLRDWLLASRPALTVTPVLDLADQRPVDGYEFPARLKEALHQVTPADAFPFAVNTGRRRDTDHPAPYVPMDRGGPPGQTGTHNGARLTRHHHRIKTHGEWKLIQPGPGLYLWRSPHGFWFRVDHTGTHRADDAGTVWLRQPSAA